MAKHRYKVDQRVRRTFGGRTTKGKIIRLGSIDRQGSKYWFLDDDWTSSVGVPVYENELKPLQDED